jgi:capsular exopolysaccharide synthesis family protein
MAQAGARVIVLDCDLRRAEQHHLFGLTNGKGLTHVLVGGAEINEVIRETRVPNLKVVTSGPLPPNPAELLGSVKTKELLEKLAEEADIVLIDSPPMLVVADAAILSSIVDGVILVIKSAKTKIEEVKQAKERLEKANARIIGTVLNAVRSSHGSYYYYDYYEYGEESKKETAVTKKLLSPLITLNK